MMIIQIYRHIILFKCNNNQRYFNKTRLVKQHPEWFWKIDEWHSLINLGNKDANEYSVNMLLGLVEKLKIQGFKFDFNF